MSLIIKGMSLPLMCEECPCYDCNDYSCNATGCGVIEYRYDGRPDNCPLMELPTPHGRLIDADRLLALVEKEVNNTCIGCEPEPDDCCAYDRFEKIISEIKTARTIIEAEVSE